MPRLPKETREARLWLRFGNGHNASLRGPEHLLVRFDRLLEGSRIPGRSLGGQSSLAMLRESSP